MQKCEHENLVAVTQILAGMRYNDSKLVRIIDDSRNCGIAPRNGAPKSASGDRARS